MTDHGSWRALAATSIDFDLDASERAELDGHVGGCTECRRYLAALRADGERLRTLDFGPAPERVHGRVAAAAQLGAAGRPSLILVFVGALLLTLATFAAAIGAGALMGERSLIATRTNAIDWQTQVARLTATDFWIEVDGTRFTAPGDVAVHSDPAGTLEMTWQEHGREMRLNLYLEADGTGWTVREIRTYDGRAPGSWIYYQSLSYRARVGDPIEGDFLVPMAKAENPGVRVATLRLEGLRLAVTGALAVRPGVNLPGRPIDAPVPGTNLAAVDPSIRPVSLSSPGDAADAIEHCRVREFAAQVVGMGRLPRASDASLYAPYSPTEEEPAWLVLFAGETVWGDQRILDAICLSFDDGRTLLPLAPDKVVPTMALPPLLP
jgi:hypothetical protein